MGIYFRYILLIRISRGANNCGQHSLEKNIYFIMRFSPHFQLFYFNDRLEFCEFFEWKIKRINNAHLFSQPPLLIFIKGANISEGHCINIVCLRDDAIHSFGCFIFNFMKASSAVNYGGVEALLFAVNRLTTAVCVSCCKMRQKVLHDGNSVIKMYTCLYCTSVMWLK